MLGRCSEWERGGSDREKREKRIWEDIMEENKKQNVINQINAFKLSFYVSFKYIFFKFYFYHII